MEKYQKLKKEQENMLKKNAKMIPVGRKIKGYHS